MRAIAIAAGLFLVAVAACGSSHRTSVDSRYDYVWQAASQLSEACARQDDPASDVDGTLWLRGGSKPLVYEIESQLTRPDVVSSLGDHFELWGQFWPCKTPVAIYTRPPSPNVVMTLLSHAKSQRRTIVLGHFRLAGGTNRDAPAGYGNAIVAANGRIVFFSGQSIRPAGGHEFTASGLPPGWLISALSVSPRDPSVFLADVSSNPNVPGGCRGNTEHGAVFLITPRASTRLRGYDACQGGVGTQWRPDGHAILWFVGADKPRLFVSDARGRHLRPLLRHPVCGALWSHDGKEIAYGYTCRRTAVLDLATGTSHMVGRGQLLAWSPDGKELALMQIHRPWYGPGTPAAKIVAVPVDGGPSRLLIRIPRTK